MLAGGQSQRMGTDKANLDWQGKTWLAHMVETLQHAGAQKVVVCRNTPTAFPTVADIIPSAGPLAGIHAALSFTLNNESLPLLVVPVDIPEASAEQLARLLVSAQEVDVVTYQDSPLPCFVNSSLAMFTQLTALLENPSESKALRRWFDDLKVQTIAAPVPFRNLNTPDDCYIS